MALFEGEDMVDVMTPDGRTLTLPRSVVPAAMMPQAPAPQAIGAMPQPDAAAMYPAQQIAPPPGVTPMGGQEIPGGFTAPTFDAPNPYEGAPPTAPLVETGEPETQRVTVMEDLPVQARPKVMKQLQAKKAAYDASPEGKQAAAQDQVNAAANAEAGAMASAADLEATEQIVVADALAERNQQIDDLFAKRAAEAQKNADAEDAKMGEIVALRKKIAGTKTDRTADHPIIAALAIALAGFGSALKGESENPAMIAFDKAIERKVAGQMADLDQMGQVYGMSKDELGMLKEKSKSRLEFHNAMLAGETEKAIRHIEELTARSASEKTKANAKIVIAQLQGRVSEKSLAAVQWGLDFKQKDEHQKAQIRAQNYATSVTDRHNKASEQIQREGIYADLQKALAADKSRGDEAMFKARLDASKDANEKGIVGADNEYLLTAAGREKMDAAKKLEADAATLESNPDVMARSVASSKIAMMKQRAAELRGDARSFDVVKMRDTADAKALSKKYAASQVMMDTVDEIKMLYEQEGRKYIHTTKGQQELQAKMGLLSVAAKDAWELGAWDKGSAALVATIIGKDPTDGWDAGAIASKWGIEVGNDPEGFRQRLDAVTVKLEQDVTQQIHKGGGRWDGKDKLFTRKSAGDLRTPVAGAVSDLTQARSGVELQEKAEGAGTVGKVARAVGYPLSPSAADEAENRQSVTRPGLSTDQEAPFNTLVAAHKKGDKRAGDQLVAEVINTAKDRPKQAIALIHNLEEHAPELAVKAKAGLPKGSDADKQAAFEANVKISRAPVPTRELAALVVNTVAPDGRVTAEAEHKELATRAGAGDAEARKAILDIANANYKRKFDKTLPRGSVFKGGR